MDIPNEFCETEVVTTTTTKKAARLGNWGGSTITSTTSNARRVQTDKDNSWGPALQDWGSERGQPDGSKLGLTGADRVSSTSSRRLSDHSRDSGDLEDDVRSVSSSSSDRRSKRTLDTFTNRGTRSRRTANFFRDDFDETMEQMIHEFDSRFSSSFWMDNDDNGFFQRRRRARNSDDFFSKPRISNRNNFSRSRMMQSLFDSPFDDGWSDRKSNLDDEYAESGIFSDRASSRQSNQTDETFKDEAPPRRLAADKFEVDIDVQGFKANELLVRTEGRRLTITAVKKDKDGNPVPNFRELKREFVLPEGVDPYDVKSNLMPDGFLRVEAPVGGKPAPKLEQPTPYPDTVSKQETAESVTSDKAESSTSS